MGLSSTVGAGLVRLYLFQNCFSLSDTSPAGEASVVCAPNPGVVGRVGTDTGRAVGVAAVEAGAPGCASGGTVDAARVEAATAAVTGVGVGTAVGACGVGGMVVGSTGAGTGGPDLTPEAAGAGLCVTDRSSVDLRCMSALQAASLVVCPAPSTRVSGKDSGGTITVSGLCWGVAWDCIAFCVAKTSSFPAESLVAQL